MEKRRCPRNRINKAGSGRLWPVLAVLVLLAGCALGDAPAPAPHAPPVPPPLPGTGPVIDPALLTLTPTPRPAAAALQSGADTPDTGWLTIGQGIERRRILVDVNGLQVPVHLARFDPARVAFRVGYAPDTPPLLAGWCRQPDSLAVINGGFFDTSNQSTALVIREGIVSGSSYQGQGGMFAIDSSGMLSLRHLADQPYSPDEPLQEALQGWPMLVKPGNVLAYTNAADSDRARRSVIALDSAGRVLLLVAPTSSFTLYELGQWLLASDLEIQAALNLDGGSSSGMCLHTSHHQERIDAFVPLPLVLVAVPRADSGVGG